jgi:hypothetical protein
MQCLRASRRGRSTRSWRGSRPRTTPRKYPPFRCYPSRMPARSIGSGKTGSCVRTAPTRPSSSDSWPANGSVRLSPTSRGASLTREKPSKALTIANDDPAGQRDFLTRAFAALDGVLGPRTPFYLFTPSGPAGTEFRLALRAVGWEHRQTLIWLKDVFVLGHSDYHYRHEEILYGFTPGPGRAGRGAGRRTRWHGGNDQGSVFVFDRPKASREHPTSKPVALIAALLRNSTRRGDLVLDPFAGSGSTLLASELLGRRCAAVELDPRYADVVRHRFQEFTGDG